MTEIARDLNETRTLSEDENSSDLSASPIVEAPSRRNELQIKSKGGNKTAKVAKSEPKTKLIDEVYEAVVCVGQPRKGATSQAIKNYIFGKRESWIKDEPRFKKLNNRINKTLRGAIENGDLVRPTTSTLTAAATGRFLLPKEVVKVARNGALLEAIENGDLIRPTASKLTAGATGRSLLPKKVAKVSNRTLREATENGDSVRPTDSKLPAAATGRSLLPKKVAKVPNKSKAKKAQDTKELARKRETRV